MNVTHYFMRHGEAKSSYEDPARSLTTKGEKEVQAVALILKQKKIQPLQIFHSEKTRAQQTAKWIGDKLQPKDGVQHGESLSPESDPLYWLEKIDRAEESLMIVSHLPFLPILTSKLLGIPESSGIIFFPGTCLALKKENGIFHEEWILHARDALDRASD